ncbi:HU family DNA-binding protein [Chryseobacterium indoltheticum]|jgi:predicted histone-like DNA-binding protein|uniref:DNA-binding protein, histone-like, putative n=1 Tax=Chryseobacterium indoltheticum TaxID=254 RepID=A0A381JQQ9_9FLAO|nr:DNA-binding protein [Chryseobacterium indoltheticum]AZA75652.1 DNA-binding protein [Chryseobacterium indoltheticum]MDF2833374.1 DNA-binding protein [Chryseobacterium indoltheticum]SIQ46268.1 DNA-binding protein, histone-like, putative [Chryseobacterium indoltheticum]SUY53782.1 putative DNA-binding protein [Chryseobacterium indoltheticum]
MPITFNVIQKRNPQDPDAPQKFYADIVGNGETTLADLAKYASTVSTVSKADILAVLESTFSKIADDVADGKIVYVGEYFTLQAGGSSEGRDTAAEVNSSSIESVRTIFRPGKMIKDALKLSTFQKKG